MNQLITEVFVEQPQALPGSANYIDREISLAENGEGGSKTPIKKDENICEQRLKEPYLLNYHNSLLLADTKIKVPGMINLYFFF